MDTNLHNTYLFKALDAYPYELEETIEALNPMETEISLIILPIVTIFRESHQEEIIIMHQNWLKNTII